MAPEMTASRARSICTSDRGDADLAFLFISGLIMLSIYWAVVYFATTKDSQQKPLTTTSVTSETVPVTSTKVNSQAAASRVRALAFSVPTGQPVILAFAAPPMKSRYGDKTRYLRGTLGFRPDHTCPRGTTMTWRLDGAKFGPQLDSGETTGLLRPGQQVKFDDLELSDASFRVVVYLSAAVPCNASTRFIDPRVANERNFYGKAARPPTVETSISTYQW